MLESSVLIQKEKIFGDKGTFYYLEQSKTGYDLYITNQDEENPENSFVEHVALFFQYETAKIVMNLLNNKLDSLGE